MRWRQSSQLPADRVARLRWAVAGGLCAQRSRANDDGAAPRKKAVIQIWLAGGPSHIDMYDLKPAAPAEFRGEFRPIRDERAGDRHRRTSAAAGEDHGQAGDRPLGLPHQRRARHGVAVDADRLAADDRSQRQHLSGLRLGGLRDERAERAPACRRTSTCRTARAGQGGVSRGVVQPVRSRQRPEQRQLPGPQPEAARPRRPWTGSITAAACIGQTRHHPPRRRHQGRHRRARQVLPRRAGDGDERQGPARRSTSERKSPSSATSYGRNDLGQSCLLARRLVEAGVTYVTIQAGGGWDTHGDNFKQLKDNLLPNTTGRWPRW